MLKHKAIRINEARVAKLADAPDLGSGGEILRGSSPLPGTHRKSKRSTLNLQLSTPNSDAVSWTLGVERSTFKSRVIAHATSVRGNVSWFPIDGFRLETHSHFARVPFLPASDSNGARDRHQERRNRQRNIFLTERPRKLRRASIFIRLTALGLAYQGNLT